MAAAIADLGAQHKRIRPHCPWRNGKVERFNRTLQTEWAYLSEPAGLLPRLRRLAAHDIRRAEVLPNLTDDTFWLIDPMTGEIVFSFPLPMVALNVRDRYVASYAIAGVQATQATKHWERKRADYQAQFAERQASQPDVLTLQ